MGRPPGLELLERFFAAFNAADSEAMLALLSDDVQHFVNQGGLRRGKALFREFNAHMSRCYREQLSDLVVFVDNSGTRGAAEFTVSGVYLATDEGLPEACGQRYRLAAGSFFTFDQGLVKRVSTHYNLQDWIAQISRPPG